MPLYFCQLLFLSSNPFERGITHSSHRWVFHITFTERDIPNTKKGGKEGVAGGKFVTMDFLGKKGIETLSSAL